MNQFLLKCALLLGSVAIINPATAAPQQSHQVQDTIVVSAYRTASLTTDLGSSVATIGRIDFEARQTVFVADVLQDLPGIAVSRSSNAGSQTQIRIRGAEANHVLVRINGIKVNDPAIPSNPGDELTSSSKGPRCE